MEKGYTQVYAGDGKGKTTAAIGLSVRAAGAGMKVYFAQFLKKWEYSELKGLERYSDLITVEQFGAGEHIPGNMIFCPEGAFYPSPGHRPGLTSK